MAHSGIAGIKRVYAARAHGQRRPAASDVKRTKRVLTNMSAFKMAGDEAIEKFQRMDCFSR